MEVDAQLVVHVAGREELAGEVGEVGRAEVHALQGIGLDQRLGARGRVEEHEPDEIVGVALVRFHVDARPAALEVGGSAALEHVAGVDQLQGVRPDVEHLGVAVVRRPRRHPQRAIVVERPSRRPCRCSSAPARASPVEIVTL